MKAIIIEDALATNGPHFTQLKNKDFHLSLGAKLGDHELLFIRFEAREIRQSWETRDRKTGTEHHFEWDNGLPLNRANSDLNVNILKYKVSDKKGKAKRFPWVTDLPLDRTR